MVDSLLQSIVLVANHIIITIDSPGIRGPNNVSSEYFYSIVIFLCIEVVPRHLHIHFFILIQLTSVNGLALHLVHTCIINRIGDVGRS
jgi:hypothetical protein